MKKLAMFMGALFLISSVLLIQPIDSSAGCILNFRIRNVGKKYQNYERQYLTVTASVKIKGGAWKKIREIREKELDAGWTKNYTHNATFGCAAKRRYKITFTQKGYAAGTHNTLCTDNAFYPSVNGWTRKLHIGFKVNNECGVKNFSW